MHECDDQPPPDCLEDQLREPSRVQPQPCSQPELGEAPAPGMAASVSDFQALFDTIKSAFVVDGELESFNLWSRPRAFTNPVEHDSCAAVFVLVDDISYPGAAVARDMWSSFTLACANALKRAALAGQGVPPEAMLRDN